MWVPVLLCLFAAVANCGVNGWKTGYIYKYDYKVCGYDGSEDMVTTKFAKADMYIRPLSMDKLSITFQNVRRRTERNITEPEYCGTFPSDERNFTNWSFSSDPFEINFKMGIFASLNVSQNTTDTDLNFMKIIADQFQLNLQDKNCEESKPCQLPSEATPNAVYHATENSIAGICDTQYEVSLLSGDTPQTTSDKKEPFILVTKTSDYKKCQQFLEKLAASYLSSFTNTNHLVVVGNQGEYTIQSIHSTIAAEIDLNESLNLPKAAFGFVTNLTLMSTDVADGYPQNVPNPVVMNSTLIPMFAA